MINDRGYRIRLFMIQLSAKPDTTQVQKLLKYICSKINEGAGLDDDQQISADNTGTLYWIDPTTEVVWADVIGGDEAWKELKQVIGAPHDHGGYFEDNKETIFQYYHERSFTPDFARCLRAPTEQVAKEYLEQMDSKMAATNETEAMVLDHEGDATMEEDDDEGDDDSDM